MNERAIEPKDLAAVGIELDDLPSIQTPQVCLACGSRLRATFALGPWADPFASTVSMQLYCPADPDHAVQAP